MTAYLKSTAADGVAAVGPVAPAMPRTLAPRATPQSVPAAAPLAQPAAAAPIFTPAPPHAEPPVPKPIAQPVAAAAAVPAPPAAVQPAATTSRPGTLEPEVLSQLLQIVSERTGYPEEMLDVTANIEADLGIDSIKRMEILTAFQQLHSGAQPGALQGAMEKLTAIKTLQETASVLTELFARQVHAAAV
jgi:hypothetical protein